MNSLEQFLQNLETLSLEEIEHHSMERLIVQLDMKLLLEALRTKPDEKQQQITKKSAEFFRRLDAECKGIFQLLEQAEVLKQELKSKGYLEKLRSRGGKLHITVKETGPRSLNN